MDMLTLDYIKTLLPTRPDESHKMTFGNVLNIAGSINYRGAAYLSSMAALRVGAGYVSLASSSCVCNSITAQTPNIVTIPLVTQTALMSSAITSTAKIMSKLDQYEHTDPEAISVDAVKQLWVKLQQTSVVSVGSGLSLMGTDDQPRSPNEPQNDSDPQVQQDNLQLKGNFDFFCHLMKAIETSVTTLILDADGINFYAKMIHSPNDETLPSFKLPTQSVLTPHPKELSRLLAVDVTDIQQQREHYATLAATKFGAVVVLKGHQTVITDGQQTFINSTGNSVLAKAGTGDVLTGMIAGFCAQGMAPLEAACLSVYLHGLAGDLVSKQQNCYSLLASDLLEYIPKAIQLVLQKTA
ncbi:NAD(P)H-hydrate dehydratase [Shewanella sp. H8]|uniref:NAD(P)H-hydrate dehydratase n=1 Tax=Shewanella sp. H8 TaxID=3342676 RepID=UPI0033157DA7